MQLVEVAAPQLPFGTYNAIVGGYASKFEANGKTYTAKFPTGVRGLNIRDVITVDAGGIHSNVLGKGGKLIE